LSISFLKITSRPFKAIEILRWGREQMLFGPANASREPLHNALRAALARPWAVHGVAFLANSLNMGCKKRLVAYADPHQRILSRFMQNLPRRMQKASAAEGSDKAVPAC
jgi:hypothetical protein